MVTSPDVDAPSFASVILSLSFLRLELASGSPKPLDALRFRDVLGVGNEPAEIGTCMPVVSMLLTGGSTPGGKCMSSCGMLEGTFVV